jgi:hypothetical protein
MENSNEKTISVNSMFGDRKIQVNMEDFIDRWVSGGSVDQMWKISELPEDMEIIHEIREKVEAMAKRSFLACVERDKGS